jgi:hypothetical protein
MIMIKVNPQSRDDKGGEEGDLKIKRFAASE